MELRIKVDLPPKKMGGAKTSTEVSGLALIPDGAVALFVYAHGAGAAMKHTFMEESARLFGEHGIATLRFNFPYIESGGKRPDRPPVTTATIRAACQRASELSDLPLIAGGKSFGGRMSSHAAVHELGVSGLAFVGFPLHGPGRPGFKRADHLAEVPLPMLFLQGTRDSLASLDLMKNITKGLGERATLHVVDGADHGFHVLKRSGRTDDEVLVELATALRRWAEALPGR